MEPEPEPVKRVLVTGMSGTGKSSVVRELVARGYTAVDTDDGWTEPLPDGRQLWREDAIRALLDEPGAAVLFVAGCEENQGKFRDDFDHVVLLTAPLETIEARLAERTTNSYGKDPEELRRVREDYAEVVPLLRRSATCEIDTRLSLDEVVERILAEVGA